MPVADPVAAGEEAAEPSPDDAKLVTLARSARLRAAAAEGAAVRDHMGRTYVAATVSLASLRLSALQAAVAAAVSSGAGQVAAAVVVSDADSLAPVDLAVLDELGVERAMLVRPDGSGHRWVPAAAAAEGS